MYRIFPRTCVIFHFFGTRFFLQTKHWTAEQSACPCAPGFTTYARTLAKPLISLEQNGSSSAESSFDNFVRCKDGQPEQRPPSFLNHLHRQTHNLHQNVELYVVNEAQPSLSMDENARCSPSLFDQSWICHDFTPVHNVFLLYYVGTCNCSYLQRELHHLSLLQRRWHRHFLFLLSHRPLHTQLRSRSYSRSKQQRLVSAPWCFQLLLVQSHHYVSIFLMFFLLLSAVALVERNSDPRRQTLKN